MSTYYQTKRGFTIIELLVVITIITLLVSVATTSYVTAQRHSRDNLRKTQVNTIAAAVESYYAANRTFPGKIDTSSSPLPSGTAASYQDSYLNCETLDNTAAPTSTFVYYYFPLSSTWTSGSALGKNVTPCDQRPALLATDGNSNYYNPADFKPFPTWIPGLGPYLNPFPSEKRYQGVGASTDPTSPESAYAELFQASDTPSSTNFTRTLAYRHLVGGYAVYTRLESDVSGTDIVTPGSLVNDPPPLPAGINPSTNSPEVDGSPIYLIRK